jgi:RNA polymerase sigma-70 factor (ECF subfamily)
MKAWLFTILRNGFYSELRRRKREREDPDGIYASRLVVDPAQQVRLHMRDLRRGLALLPAEQREAIILVSAGGCEYEEAAGICGCPVGTIKSRVSRARHALLAYFESAERAGGMTASRDETAASPSRRGPGAASRDDASGP